MSPHELGQSAQDPGNMQGSATKSSPSCIQLIVLLVWSFNCYVSYRKEGTHESCLTPAVVVRLINLSRLCDLRSMGGPSDPLPRCITVSSPSAVFHHLRPDPQGQRRQGVNLRVEDNPSGADLHLVRFSKMVNSENADLGYAITPECLSNRECDSW